MKKRLLVFLFLAHCAFPVLAEVSNLLERVHANIFVEGSTVYKTRGTVIDSKPLIAESADLILDLSPFGFIGGNIWAGSAVARNGQSYLRRNGFNEFYSALYYGYDLRFGEDWALRTGVGRGWDSLVGYRDDLCKGFYEWMVMQSFENPYVTPYYLFRRGRQAANGEYWEVGLKRTFELTEQLCLTVNFFAEFCNGAHMKSLWGDNPCTPDGRYVGGLLAFDLDIRLAYYLTEWLNVYVYVHQFDIVNPDFRNALGHYESLGMPEAITDITYGGIGVQIQF